jgi:hypothetical protein
MAIAALFWTLRILRVTDHLTLRVLLICSLEDRKSQSQLPRHLNKSLGELLTQLQLPVFMLHTTTRLSS